MPSSATNNDAVQVRIFVTGSRGLLVETESVDTIERILALRSTLGGALIDYAVPAARSVLVVASSEELVPALRLAIKGIFENGAENESRLLREPVVHVIPTRYGGEDLVEAARLCGMSEREFVRAHAESEHRIAFFGFAPGFAYIDGSDRRLDLPRRESPRKNIAAGIVAVAACQSVIYPGNTPGGWHLIGKTDFVSWNLTENPPTPFEVGDTVVFQPIGQLP